MKRQAIRPLSKMTGCHQSCNTPAHAQMSNAEKAGGAAKDQNLGAVQKGTWTQTPPHCQARPRQMPPFPLNLSLLSHLACHQHRPPAAQEPPSPYQHLQVSKASCCVLILTQLTRKARGVYWCLEGDRRFRSARACLPYSQPTRPATATWALLHFPGNRHHDWCQICWNLRHSSATDPSTKAARYAPATAL